MQCDNDIGHTATLSINQSLAQVSEYLPAGVPLKPSKYDCSLPPSPVPGKWIRDVPGATSSDQLITAFLASLLLNGATSPTRHHCLPIILAALPHPRRSGKAPGFPSP